MVERVNCPVCEFDDSELIFKKAGFGFNKCNSCGLLHVNPQLTEKTQQEIYKNSKTADHWIKLQSKSSEQSWNESVKYGPALEELEKLYPDGGELLDVGCSIGQFLELAIAKGWDAEGIELNLDAAEIAKNVTKKKIHTEKIEDINFGSKLFDVVTLWGVFEHLNDPNSMLRSVRKLLKPGGAVLVFVPNGHSLIIRLSRQENSTVSGRSHLWYFTPDTLDRIFRKNGFEKSVEFSVMPQLHEIEHFLRYNILYQETKFNGVEEFSIPEELRESFEQFILKNKMGYKLISIAKKAD